MGSVVPVKGVWSRILILPLANTLNLPDAGCCRVVTTLRFGSPLKVLQLSQKKRKKHFTIYNKYFIAVPFFGENFGICSSYVLHFYFIYIRI